MDRGGITASQVWTGVSPFQVWTEGVLPFQVWIGVPHPADMGYPLDGVPPVLTWEGNTPLPRPGKGVPPVRKDGDTPLSTDVNRHTPVKTVPSLLLRTRPVLRHLKICLKFRFLSSSSGGFRFQPYSGRSSCQLWSQCKTKSKKNVFVIFPKRFYDTCDP